MAESSVDEGASRTINAGSEVGQGIDPLTGVDNGGERESCPGMYAIVLLLLLG